MIIIVNENTSACCTHNYLLVAVDDGGGNDLIFRFNFEQHEQIYIFVNDPTEIVFTHQEEMVRCLDESNHRPVKLELFLEMRFSVPIIILEFGHDYRVSTFQEHYVAILRIRHVHGELLKTRNCFDTGVTDVECLFRLLDFGHCSRYVLPLLLNFFERELLCFTALIRRELSDGSGDTCIEVPLLQCTVLSHVDVHDIEDLQLTAEVGY